MRECKITAIEPNGWLRQVLLAQKNGMPGHLDEIGYPYNEYCWSFASLLEGGIL